MKTKQLITLAVTGLMAARLCVPVYAEQGKSIFEQAGTEAPQCWKGFQTGAR